MCSGIIAITQLYRYLEWVDRATRIVVLRLRVDYRICVQDFDLLAVFILDQAPSKRLHSYLYLHLQNFCLEYSSIFTGWNMRIGLIKPRMEITGSRFLDTTRENAAAV